MAAVLKFGERVPKTKDTPQGWRELFKYHFGKQAPDSLLGHKSVLCFPGDGSIDAKELNGYCKNIEAMLLHAGLSKSDMPNLYVLGFDTLTTDDIRRQAFSDVDGVSWEWRPENREEPQKSTFKTKEIDHPQVFFDAYLRELIEDEEGHPRSAEEIKKNFENLTIFTHCHGSVFAYLMEKMFAEKLKGHYPDQVQELLGHLRMIHLAARNPISKKAGAKHFEVVSQDDGSGVDAWVAYDNLYKAVKRLDLPLKSGALLHMGPRHDLLLAERFIGVQEDGNDDHEYFMPMFSSRGKQDKMSPEGLKIVAMTQQLLKHFVEHPEDSRDIIEILSEMDPKWTESMKEKGKKIQQELVDERSRDAGLLSFLGKYAGSIGRMHTTHVGQKLSWEQAKARNQQVSYLFQEDSENKVLYERVKQEYQKTGDSRSLINLIKVFGDRLPPQEISELFRSSLNTGNWVLCRVLTSRTHLDAKYLIPILREMSPISMKHMIPMMKKTYGLEDEALIQKLITKSKKIKNTVDRIGVQNFLQTIQNKIDERKKRMAEYMANREQ